ncbi:MAG: ABC transporter ATP-binding protein [Burkholderiales bacterium]|nr:ABC transporter ATP-binding protein [Burkholderiales bacterium]
MDGTAATAPSAPAAAGAALIEVENLHVSFATPRGTVRAVDGLSWNIRPGEVLALVGESGCGKSVSALALLRLLADNARVEGRIVFEGRDLLQLPVDALPAIRGRDIAMIFQDPLSALNPVLRIGFQVAEPLRIHLGMSAPAAKRRAIELLQRVGIPDAARRVDDYPHQLSGGMRQRVVIATAIACNPRLIIADEPTTALDVTLQAQILGLLRELAREQGIALLLITHNLGIVARYADRVSVMYAARMAEEGPAAALFARPLHPYTAGLLRAVPRLDRPRGTRLDTIEGAPPDLLDLPAGCRFAPRCAWRIEACTQTLPELKTVAPRRSSACLRALELDESKAAISAQPSPRVMDAATTPLLQVRGLSVHYDRGRGQTPLRAVSDVSFDVPRGRTLGLVGESGCGKTTVGRALLRLETAAAGNIVFDGAEVTQLSGATLRAYRRGAQVVFQDPYHALNPRMTLGAIIGEPLRVHRLVADAAAARARVNELLQQVGLSPDMAARYPHQLSGGQRQRAGIARALALQPSFIVCDEPVSALDVSIQAQIVNLLEDLQRELGLSYLFIAHDLAVVRHIADRVLVMYLGRVMEMADRDALYAAPLHPYTQLLLESVPVPDPAVEARRPQSRIAGEAPAAPASGCVFQGRCPRATVECGSVLPPLREIRPGHHAACLKL